MDGSLVFLVHAHDISIEYYHTGHAYSVYDIDKYVSGHMEDTHAHTDTSMAEPSIKVRTHHALDAPQAAPATYVVAGIDMRANADLWGGKGERKELPGHRPGRPEAELRRPERLSGSDRAGLERGMRAAARLGTTTSQMEPPARAPAACGAAVPHRGGRRRRISAGRAQESTRGGTRDR